MRPSRPDAGPLPRLRCGAAALAVPLTLAAAVPPPAAAASHTPSPGPPRVMFSGSTPGGSAAGGSAAGGSAVGATFAGATFSGVSSVSATDAWAAGTIPGPGRLLHTLVARWNGTSWSRVPSPSAGRPDNSVLNGVSADSASGGWAVGYYGTGLGLLSLVLRWNGTSWSRVPSPSPGAPAGPTTLAGVSAVSASEAWAVGSYGNNPAALVLRWNGTRWAQVPSPAPAGARSSTLLGVTGVPGSGAWAVGCFGSANGGVPRTLALHWNGSRWTPSAISSPGVSACLTSVTAVSPSDAWAAGWVTVHNANGPDQALIMHWDGTRWSRVPSPSPRAASTMLTGISAISRTDAWAVGKVLRNGASLTYTLRWIGTHWLPVASPSPGFSVLYGVSDISARNALAVGSGGSGSLALRWNGSRWVTT